MPLGDTRRTPKPARMFDVCSTHAHSSEECLLSFQLFPLKEAPRYIAGIYDRRDISPGALWDHLSFKKALQLPHHDTVRENLCQLFLRRVGHYIFGSGHPNHPNIVAFGAATSDDINAMKDDTSLRSRGLLLAARDSELWPILNHWEIAVGPYIVANSNSSPSLSTVYHPRS